MKTPIRFEYPGPLDDVIVTMEYSAPAVGAIRNLPQWARTFDAATRTWRIHPAWADRLAASLRRRGYEVADIHLDRTA